LNLFRRANVTTTPEFSKVEVSSYTPSDVSSSDGNGESRVNLGAAVAVPIIVVFGLLFAFAYYYKFKHQGSETAESTDSKVVVATSNPIIQGATTSSIVGNDSKAPRPSIEHMEKL